MKIISLVNDESLNTNLISSHGLSLYIETNKHKILFDLGSDQTIFKNARYLNIDLTKVDIVIISHGHYDHGGALKDFLNINNLATIYIQESSFNDYYSKRIDGMHYIGLDKDLKYHNQIKLLNGNYIIDDELKLFTVKEKSTIDINNTLYCEKENDDFIHEQNLLINDNTLICGCGHKGINNILNCIDSSKIKLVVGGFHLYSNSLNKNASDEIINGICEELKKYQCKFYTCHCTGQYAFKIFQENNIDINNLKCGEVINK